MQDIMKRVNLERKAQRPRQTVALRGRSAPARNGEASPAPVGSAMPAKPMKEFLKRPRAATYQAPETFKVRFETTKGDFVIQVTRAWAPNGVDRFYNLTRFGYWDDVAFFRVIDGFMIQFGIHGDPSVMRNWKQANVIDDPVIQSNSRGYLSFAKTSRPNSRTTQLFINLGDNSRLDKDGFAPFAQVIQGMDIVDQIYKVGEAAPSGPGPSQRRIQISGNDYLKKNFPKIDYINRAWFTE
jgi:peptidyl-prolyl cis-trans isomerase A (cyclophilin A)